MIKLISFNNFDNFDAKTNASIDGNEDLAQDFTAIFNVFAPPQPEAEIFPQSVKIINSDENQFFVKSPEQDQVFEGEKPEIENEKILTFFNENGEQKSLNNDLKTVNKLEFVNQTKSSVKSNFQGQNENSLIEPYFSIDLNPAVIQKEKISHYKNIPDLSQTLNLFENIDRKTFADSIISKEVHNLQTDKFQKSTFDATAENSQKIQFDITSEEEIPNSINNQNSQPKELVGSDQENNLYLPETNPSAKAVENKVEYPSVKIENFEFTSLETSIKNDKEPLKFENSINFETEKNDFLIKREKISAGKVLIEENLNQFSNQIEEIEFAAEKFEIAELKSDEIHSAIENVEFSSFDKSDIENKTGQFVEIDPKAEKILEKVKTEPQIENKQFQFQNLNQTQNANSDSIQSQKIEYFLNTETNRVEEVKNGEKTEYSFSNLKETNIGNVLRSDTENQTQNTHNVSKPLNKISDIFQKDRPENNETTHPQVNTPEQNETKTLDNKFQEFVVASPVQNEIQMANSVGKRKLSERLISDINNKSRDFADNDLEISQNSGNLQNPDSSLNPQNDNQKTAVVTDQISTLQSEQTISKVINNPTENSVRKPIKPLNFSNEFSGLSFEQFLKSVQNKQPNIEAAPKSLFTDKTVFEQIEPKIIELATFVQKSEEKQYLKMRLNPAELGEVEIKLEKDASGKINAHIRTENEAARHILAESLGQLRDSLQNSGWQVEKLEVHCNPNQSSGNEQRENHSRENETGRNTAFGFDGNVENEDETAENSANRLVNLRA
jgi:flagellar hook-length control protein FliK